MAATDDEDEKYKNESSFRILQFNILGQGLIVNHTYADPKARSLEHRSKLFQELIVQHQPDLITLQEMDIFQEVWGRMLNRLGYAYHFEARPRTADGCLLAWRKKRFAALGNAKGVTLDKLRHKMGPFVNEQGVTMTSLRYVRNNIGCAIPLKDIASSHAGPARGVLLATTHLFWDPAYADLKQLQAEFLVYKLEKMYHSLPAQHPGFSRASFPLVLAGDFNALPDSSVYRFFVTGQISKDQRPPWFGGAPPASSPNLDEYHKRYHSDSLSHSFSLASAYSEYLPKKTEEEGQEEKGEALGAREPPFTNFTPTFQGTLDYIFYDNIRLARSAVHPLPSVEEVSQEAGGLPNSKFPSDHLPLVAELFFRPIK